MSALKRSLSLWQLTLMSVGIILGAGIYVILGEAAGLSGNCIWLSFIIAAIVAALTVFSYAELSSRFPKAGAEYVYVENSFGNRAAWIVAWLLLAGSVFGGATVAMGFAQYFSAIFHTDILIISLIILGIIGIILIAGIQQTAKITILFTTIEIAGLVLVIFIGLPYIGSVNYLEAAQGLKGVIEAGVLIFFGYLGFEGITRLAEETKKPREKHPQIHHVLYDYYYYPLHSRWYISGECDSMAGIAHCTSTFSISSSEGIWRTKLPHPLIHRIVLHIQYCSYVSFNRVTINIRYLEARGNPKGVYCGWSTITYPLGRYRYHCRCSDAMSISWRFENYCKFDEFHDFFGFYCHQRFRDLPPL